MLTHKRLKEVLDYNPDTGIFVWKIRTSNCVCVGDIAGNLDNGYVKISVDGKTYKAHRLAWLYVHGVWPSKHIDHKNHNRANNWIDNLRDVSVSGNQQNQIKAHTQSKTCVLGVHEQNGKFIVQVSVGGKQKYIGIYSTLKIAEGVSLRAKRKYHPTCTI